MYIFKEDFSVKNDKNIPYSLAEQNIHPYSNPSAVVENNKLLFTRECARLFLKTPFLNHFKFKCQIGFTSPASAFNKHAGWGFFFGYNPDNHTGNQLKLSYFEKTSTLKIQLYEVTGKKSVLISESVYENLKLHSEEMYNFSLSVEENKCFGNAFGICFSFQCNNTRGKIGISNESSTNGLYFSELIVESSDVDYTIVTDKEFVIPYYDGGSEDYCIHIIVKKYTGGTYELSYTLTGGVYSRNTKDYKRNIWSVQYDIIRNAYIKFYGNPGTDKLFLKNGELRFVEQNETYKDTELALNGEKMPFAGKFRFEEFDENADFAFGYELFRRLGNELQEGRREYVYRNGNLIYSGTPLYEDYIIAVQSPANKKIATLIPKNIDKYENALFHAQSNHYFMHDEPVTFKVTTHIRKDCELTKLNITLLDAFFDEIQSVEYSSTPTEKFYEYGFTTFEHNINLGEMTQEVYHIKAEILLGDDVVCKHISAFEVIDNSKLSPRQSSKIPFIYSGEAAPPNIEFNCPDPWMIKPDHNEAHYIDCLLTLPEVAENRNGWDIMKLYKKTMFTWINNRTIPHKKTYRDYPNCLKNSDYARIQPLEAVELVSYITNPSIFTKPTVLGIYQDFKNEHKDYVLPDISENGRISTEDFTEFYKTHGSEWIEYLCNPDKNIRTFWIRHMQAVREIAEYIGKELNQSCVCNYWVQDGMKDMPANRIKYRALMKDSFDEVFSKKKISPQYVYDALEPKLFAVGVEEYTVGSNDFYLSYHGHARSKGIGNTIMNLDLGHFHCEENVADKISSVMLFSDKFMAHFTRGLRWDSDHVVINDDKTNNMMREIVRCGVLDNTFIGTDYFDASVNRVAAWTIGTRATKKALLSAMLEPVHLLQKAEDEQDFTLRLALMDEFKSLPSSAVWDYYCVKSNIPANTEWLNDLKTYEKDVMFKR